MEIIEFNSTLETQLKSFKSLVWLLADKEHYGDNQPNFFRSEFTLIVREDLEMDKFLK